MDTIARSANTNIRFPNDAESIITQLWLDEAWQSSMTDIQRRVWGRAASELLDYAGVHGEDLQAELKFQLRILRSINDEYREAAEGK